jgi:hypothetical protein
MSSAYADMMKRLPWEYTSQYDHLDEKFESGRKPKSAYDRPDDKSEAEIKPKSVYDHPDDKSETEIGQKPSIVPVCSCACCRKRLKN